MVENAPYQHPHHEGPYLRWLDSNKLQFTYLEEDSASAKVMEVEVGEEETLWIPGQLQDSHELYPIHRNPRPPAAVQDGIDKILVLGDMHGMYEKLFRYLLNNKVIDRQGHWSWESGQLVISGDIFDRGNQVTETLWFLYRLEQEAAAAGGAVHYLLGNHELMVMENDLRYVHGKYLQLFRSARQSYAAQFDQETVFGQWLRSRNTVICLNDILLSHAGISPAVAAGRLGLEQINKGMRKYLQQNHEDSITRLLRGQEGPLWYRAYIMSGWGGVGPGQEELEAVLQQYGASHMVVAHTTVDSVQARYQRKLFAVDLDVNDWQQPLEGLLCKRGKFFRLKEDATTVEL